MTTNVNLTPNATRYAGGTTLTGAATAHAALALGDSHYVTIGSGGTSTGSFVIVDLGDVDLSYVEPVSFEIAITARQNGSDLGGNEVRAELYVGKLRYLYGGNEAAPGSMQEDPTITPLASNLVAAFTVSGVGTSFDTEWSPPVTTRLTQAEWNRAFLVVYGDFGFDMDVSEVFLDVEIANSDTDVVNVPAITSPWTASTTPELVWFNDMEFMVETPTGTAQGVQSKYHIRVYDETTYGASYTGVDPADTDTYPPYWDSRAIVSQATTARIGPLANSDGYRAYVRIAQTVNGRTLWTPWIDNTNANYTTFDLSVTTSDVDTVTTVDTAASALITVTVNRDTGTPGWEYIEVQRSDDSGSTWSYVRGAQFVTASGNSFEVIDYEAPNGVSVIYRARATYYSGGFPITGDWAQSSADSWTSTDTWLKDPLTPASNITVRLRSVPGEDAEARRGVFPILGNQRPVVVRDAMSSDMSDITIAVSTVADAETLKTLISDASVLLFQTPDDQVNSSRYIAVGGRSRAPASLRTVTPYNWITLRDCIDVDAPGDATAGSL